ncbi:hypothetical protein CH63R_10917 [Colletotrichum higginsianum IMI 349063]|uniref:Uncharacterized protein n=1 Tax=Colletotrichum higginsianum (strain IMI 349063) TaxID=759273 RepID=A0A1B7Y430_COLHI|nr:uncharacterized protein CH63R_10917 [Colletotrichum higginsianum IMI 349063]OBR06797.1 hypothetical protein CH63R_10917 [Colletotrichum higginsianum IMI 349063]
MRTVSSEIKVRIEFQVEVVEGKGKQEGPNGGEGERWRERNVKSKQSGKQMDWKLRTKDQARPDQNGKDG